MPAQMTKAVDAPLRQGNPGSNARHVAGALPMSGRIAIGTGREFVRRISGCPSGSRLTFESPEGIPRDLNACESGACEPESPLLLNLLIAAV